MQLIKPEFLTPHKIAELRVQFNEAKPYRHIVLDNFLTAEAANELYSKFPTVESLKIHWKGMNEKKSEGANFQDFAPVFSSLREEMASEVVSKWVSAVTGIADVSITNDHLGAGLHQGSNGSFLDIHIDFNIHHVLNVHRRLNLLIYLEKNWKEEFGGQLEMWNADMTKCEKWVVPAFNRCVIFETSEISYHGYSKITIPEGVTRKSFYSYFYTKERDGAFHYHDTVFKARPEEGLTKKVKTTIKENLKNTAKMTLKKLGIKF